MSKISLQKTIAQAPEEFESLILSKRKSVVCNKQGHFYVENCLIAIIKKIVSFIFVNCINFKALKYESWAKGLIHVFDQIEQKPFEINKDLYTSYLKTAKTVKGILKQNKSARAQVAYERLKVRTTALKFRLSGVYSNKYLKQEKPDVKLYEELRPHAEAWKATQIIFRESKLSPKEIRQLERLTQYPKFAALVRNNPKLRDRFFEWALIGKATVPTLNNVDAFIQFPKTVEKLIDSTLSEKIASYGGEDLQIEEIDKQGKRYKDLTLPFEGKRESILDEKHIVTLSHNYRLSIGEIFEIFKVRDKKVDNLEYFGEGKGITNWNANEWGAYDPAISDYHRLDMNDLNWIKNAPYSEEISEEEARKRFEDKNGQKLEFGQNDWIFTAIGKNQYKHANLTGTHSFLGIAVPMGNGKRRLYYIGKFAWSFPDFEKEKIQYLRMAFDTVKGSLQLPDENVCKIKRDEEGISWRATEDQAKKILERIRQDKIKMKNESFFYQILNYNCTDWVFKKLRDLVSPQECEEIASMHMWEAQPEETLPSIIIKLPVKVREKIFNLSVKFMKPKGQIKKRKNGEDKPIVLTVENGPWNKDKKRLHPSKIILGKRSRKIAIAVSTGA